MHSPKRGVLSGAVATALAVVALLGALVIATPAIASAQSFAPPSGDSPLVGEPEQFLIESRHATGKVLVIGSDDAMTTHGPDGTPQPAAAAIFSTASAPDDLLAQAVIAYPLIASPDTFVFANRSGDVLVRNDNDGEHVRYLHLAAVSIDEAARNPLAQWRVVDLGGDVRLENVQPDGNGVTQTLDMYNWRTDDGAEIQTYDAGTAAVQRWTLRSLDAQVAPYEALVQPGQVPTPPTALDAMYAWDLRHTLTDITWDMPPADAWTMPGTIIVEGEAAGFFGEPLAVRADYLVGELGDALDATVEGYAGITIKELQMIAPTTVARTISGSDQTRTAPVTWDWSGVTAEQLAGAGTVTVPAAEGTGFDARLQVIVTAATEINVLRQPDVNATYTHKDGTPFALADGDRDRLGFADWRSGGAENRVNPNTVTFHLPKPTQITGVAVFDVGGQNNIGTITVQYRDLIGGWVDLPVGATNWPVTNDVDELRFEATTSAPLLAVGVRVIITPKSTDTWMSLSEVEVTGLGSAVAS